MKTLSLVSMTFLASVIVEAHAAPPVPTAYGAQRIGPTAITVSWLTNYSDTHAAIRFEIASEKNGTPIELHLSPLSVLGVSASNLQSYEIDNLDPDQHYCFRIFSRDEGDTRSDSPSAPMCANTTLNPPLAPISVVPQYDPMTRVVSVSWSTPDQSNDAWVQYYEVERQDVSVANSQAVIEVQFHGPYGRQDAKAPLDFYYKLPSRMDRIAGIVVRVCSINSGGRVCSQGVTPQVSRTSAKAAANMNAALGSASSGKSIQANLPSSNFSNLTHTAGAASSGASSSGGQSPESQSGCAPQYVLREATLIDTVCVTPKAYARVQEENQRAGAHRKNKGASSPVECKSSYVWRDATSGDHVCVTPKGRELAQEENANAAKHRAK